MQVSPPVLIGGVVALILVLVVLPMLAFREMSRRDALARQAAQADLEASRRSARQRRDEVKRSETILTLPTYEREVDKEEELSKFEAEIKRLESGSDSDTPENRTLLIQLKSEVARLNRWSSSSSGSSTLSATPIPIPPPTYIPLNTVRHEYQS